MLRHVVGSVRQSRQVAKKVAPSGRQWGADVSSRPCPHRGVAVENVSTKTLTEHGSAPLHCAKHNILGSQAMSRS